MKKILLLITALLAIPTLSAQNYKVGDIYDVDGKRGVVFEVSEDGTHGKIISTELVSDKMTWSKAMEWGSQLKDGWYLPSYDELMVLLKVRDEVMPKMTIICGYYWTTTEFNPDCAWMVSIKTDSRGAMYKGNKFNVQPILKF